MAEYQFWTLLAMLAAGFGWLIHQMNRLSDRVDKTNDKISALENRITVLETRMGFIERLLEMATGSKINLKEKTDP